MKVKRRCLECGKEFYIYPSSLKRGEGKYCSCECSGKAQSKNRIGDRSAGWQGGKIKRICKECGKEFEVKPSAIKRGGGLFCSRSCYRKKGKIKRFCKECNNIFSIFPSQLKKGNGKYCSHSCAMRAIRHKTKSIKTLPERIFEEVCKKFNLPFHFIGDGSLWVGNANPDFIHNTRKIVVEIYGDYWHSPLLNGNIRYSSTLGGRTKQLKAEGYKLIVIWETDLKRKDTEAFVLYTLEKHNIFPSTA